MAPISKHLLPANSSVDPDGALRIAGVRIDDLAAEYGTPLFVYDEDHIRSNCRALVAEFGVDNVVYASKAFLCKAMAGLVHTEGLMLDVASGGELFVALAAGVPANRCVLHGNNKSDRELIEAIEAGVHHIVVDSFDELVRLDAIHTTGLPAARIQLRVTPGVHVHTHEFVATGQDDSKFGFNLSNGDAARAVALCKKSKSVELLGLHCHIGSQVFAADNFTAAAKAMVEFFAPLGLEELTLGGGLGVAYLNNEPTPTYSQWGSALKEATRSLPSSARVIVEPGRSLVAATAVTIYSVGTVKNISGIRKYISVDGGMSDNPRPIMYGSGYEAFDPMRVDADRPDNARIVGKHCESGDIVILDASIPANVKVDDLLVTPVTGAYGYSMASNYNKIGRPAVVFVSDGNARLVVRREEYEDLVRLDIG